MLWRCIADDFEQAILVGKHDNGSKLPAESEIAARYGVNRHTVRRAMAELGPRWSSALELLDFGAEHFVVALRDDPDLMDRILSGRESQYGELWHRATNVDPLQDVHGLLGARLSTP